MKAGTSIRQWLLSIGTLGMSAMLLAAVGCKSQSRCESPSYAVRWAGDEAPGGRYFLISPGNRFSFAMPELHLENGRDEIPLLLFLSNHTGHDVFIRRLGESVATNLTWRVRSVSATGVEEWEGVQGPVLGGCGAVYSMLWATDEDNSEVVCDRPVLYEIRATIPLEVDVEHVEYVDAMIEFPLYYYVLGSVEGQKVTVRRSMRVYFGAAIESGKSKVQCRFARKGRFSASQPQAEVKIAFAGLNKRGG